MNTKTATFFKKADQYRTAIIIGIFFLYTVFMQACLHEYGIQKEYADDDSGTVLICFFEKGSCFCVHKLFLTEGNPYGFVFYPFK